MKPWTVEQRFPTKKARDAADAAIVALDANEPMTAFVDLWIAKYREDGGIERRPK